MKGNGYRKLYGLGIYKGFQAKGHTRKMKYRKRKSRRMVRRAYKFEEDLISECRALGMPDEEIKVWLQEI